MHENPYIQLLRLHRPIGFFLLWWPCVWGLLLAGNLKDVDLPNWKLLFVVTAGAFLTRTMGCIINDICDRDIDAKVKRTVNRPIASGKISVRTATYIAGVLGTGALVCLIFLPLKAYVIAGIAAVLIFVYPKAKRFMPYPQAVLAFTMNMGLLLTYVAATDSLAIPLPVWLAYLAAAAWTLGYDTIYALQDHEDDRHLGVGSTALIGEAKAKKLILVSYLSSSLFLSIIPFVMTVSRNYIAALILWFAFLMWQVFRLNVRNELTLDDLFHSNGYGAIFLGLAFGLLV